MVKKKNISIKEIAKLADVSVATVSRVINNNGRFSDKTKEKVETIIKEYGYTANIAAKSLRTSKSKTIGLIVPNIDNEWFSQLALDIENYFFKHNYSEHRRKCGYGFIFGMLIKPNFYVNVHHGCKSDNDSDYRGLSW